MSSDAQLAAELARSPSEGLTAVYTAYSAKLYTYALTMVRDPSAAQDVVHDSLLVAAGSIGQLRDPAKLRPWLYAITRNECLRALRTRNRFSDSDEVIDVPDDSIDFDAGLRREEASRLIAHGMAAMNPADRDILTLALQHDLDVDHISRVTGAKPNALHARLSRARAGLSDAISALALHRTRGRDCDTLAAILAPPDQPLTPLLRKRILRHLKDCADCERRRRAALAAMGPAMAAPVFVPPPADLLSRIQQSLQTGQAIPLSAAAGPLDGEGFPRPLDTRRSHTRLLPAAATIAVVLLVVMGLLVTGDRSNTTSEQAIIGAATTSAPPASSASSPPPSPDIAPSADDQTSAPDGEPTLDGPAPSAATPLTPRSTTKKQTAAAQDSTKRQSRPTKTSTPKPIPTAAAPPVSTPGETAVPPPVITGVTLVDVDKGADGGFTRCDAFTLRITASVTGEVETVEATIAPIGSVIPLVGGPHEGTVTLPPGDYTVSVEAIGPGGSATRDAGSVLHICPG
jgi:RNA polymerase sigma factor (sigma-70 family)